MLTSLVARPTHRTPWHLEPPSFAVASQCLTRTAKSRVAAFDKTLPRGQVKESSLLCLPAELRSLVWMHTLGGMVFEVHCWVSYGVNSFATRILNRQKNFLGLLRTCRRIYAEAKLTPFKFNAFRIKTDQGLHALLNGLEATKREVITEIHLVTWRALHMVERLSDVPQPVSDNLALARLPGLRKLYVDVRIKSICRDCRRGRCERCDPELGLLERHLVEYVKKGNERIELVLERTCYASVAALQVL
ncbi:hypothetical protein PMIN01_12087 [Paraphaeosphaeria minitans]|uniref:DUF7730 domain-containing protein n=1 Tax=Paraphaeosphaeria minitans TaxID=565426 RepID=A0A9P6G787_9PLEO|nr:hypothetical protein PMIN01_12087 [Paraphaeosphaeria minitans]